MELRRLLTLLGMVVCAALPGGCTALEVKVVAVGVNAPTGSAVIAKVESGDGEWAGATYQDAQCLYSDLSCVLRFSPEVHSDSVMRVQAWLDSDGDDWDRAAGSPEDLAPDDADPSGSASLAAAPNGTHQVTVSLKE